MERLERYKPSFFNRDSKINKDNNVFVYEREYAITEPDDPRPVLWTDSIVSCLGIVIYDRENNKVAMAHMLNPEKHTKFDQGFEKTLYEVMYHLKEYGSSSFEVILGAYNNDSIYDEIFETEKILLEKKILTQPFRLIEDDKMVFDARIGCFCSKPDHLKFLDYKKKYLTRMERRGKEHMTGMGCLYEPKLGRRLIENVSI